MKTVSLALLGLTLVACGQKPGTGGDTGDSVTDADNDGFDSSVDCDDSNADINPDADEICDGVDNNCDGVRDEDSAVDAPSWYADSDSDTYGDPATSQSACEAPAGYVADSSDCNDSDASINPDTTWYADADSDGYGDPGATQQACEQPSGFVTIADDCDDSDGQVNPDAAEICDGIDNDCDTSTSEDGMVSYVDPSGNAVDVTADVSGPPAGPQAYTLSDGELHFCDGTFYTHLLIDGDAALRSVNADPTQAILDGGGKGRTVTVAGEMMDVAIEDLTITGGAGFVDEFSFDGSSAAGGGLACAGLDLAGSGDLPEGLTSLTLENVLLVGNAAPLSAGLFSIYCNTSISNSEISDNYGVNVGALVIYDGAHEFTNVDIVNNEADFYAAGGITSLATMSTTVILDDVVVSGNTNSTSGGGSPVFGLLYGTDVTWTGTAGSMGSGFWGNDANGEIALELTESTTLNASTVDFGSAADGTGNLDIDIDNDGIEYWVARDDASFSCEAGACGSSTTTTVLNYSDADDVEPLFLGLGSVFTVDSQGTLDAFSIYSQGTEGNCTLEFRLLSTSNPSSGSWTVEWSDTQVVGSKASWYWTDPIGMVLDESLTYAAYWAPSDCTHNISTDKYVSSTVAIPGIGELTNDYIYSCDTGSVGSTVNCNEGFFTVHFSQQFETTEL